MKIRKGDKIKILAGKDKGKEGKVLRVLAAQKKVVIEGLNLVKKHQRGKRQGEKGQVVEIPRAIDVSNVALICPACAKTARIGFRLGTGKEKNKKRICKKCNQEI